MEKWNDRLKSWVTSRSLSFFLTITYVVSLIPLLWIGKYNFPSADDFTNGSGCHHVWEETHSIFAVLGEAFSRMKYEWFEWRGCFTSSFLSALAPNFLGEGWYTLTVWIILGMLTASTVYLLYVIFTKVFKTDKYASLCVAMLVLFITIQCMVEKGRVEALYWYSGAINYTFVHGISLFFYGVMISALYEKGKRRIGKLVLASFLGFLTGGGNQLTALNAAIVMVVVAGFLTALKKWKTYKGFAIPICFCLLGFLLSIAAPGNSVRMGVSSGMNPIKAVLVSFYYCLDYCMGEWLEWPVVLLVLVLIPLFWHMARQTEFSFSYPLVVVLFGYCIVSAMMTPSLFATGNVEAGRLQGLTFTMFILVLTLCAGYVTGWMQKKCEVRGWTAEKDNAQTEQGKQSARQFSVSSIWCLLGGLAFFGAATVITVIPDPHYFTCSSAIIDLANGSAKEYHDSLAQRTELYESGEMNVEVEPLSSQPVLLYFSDIKPDSEDWENKGLCRFYGIESVKVKKE